MLKEKVIELLNNDPTGLDMFAWLEKSYDELYDEDETSCGTVGCFAGYIVRAAETKLICGAGGMLYPSLDSEVLDDFKHSPFFEKESEIAAYARYLWAKEYGYNAASKLPFHSWEWDETVGFSFEKLEAANNSIALAFGDLKARDVVRYLESLP